jgi:hypothetical protein
LSRVAIVRSEKVVTEAGETSGIQRKGNVHYWEPLQAADNEDIEGVMYVVVTVII